MIQVKGRVICDECGAIEEVWLVQYVGKDAPPRVRQHIFPPNLPEGWVETNEPPTAQGAHRCPGCAEMCGCVGYLHDDQCEGQA